MGAEDYGSSPLPVRTTRYLRPGRHSSPHQLSLPAEVPALVLAVPGSASPASDQIAAEIAASAGSSCPGATIAAGYLEGSESRLSEVLGDLRSQDGRPPAVVVPLLVPLYDKPDPTLFGFPFYYWFQFALILLSAVLTSVAFVLSQRTVRRREGSVR